MKQYNKPLPIPDPDTKGYWEAAKKHQLVVKKCAKCGYYCFPPYPICPKCHSMSMEWAQVSGKGKIYSWVNIDRATHPDFADAVPYTVALVEIDEQNEVRLPGNLLDCPRDKIKAGMPVEVSFVDVTEEVTLPQWKPRK